MPETTERMAKLQQMLAREPDDAFLIYALAMEYKKAGAHAEALDQFARVLQKDPGYVVAYQQAGQVHEAAGDPAAARRAYEDGIAAATRKGDFHAAEEMKAALLMFD